MMEEELMTVYYSMNQRHVVETSISVVSVSRLMANSSLQVLKIVKSGYVLSHLPHPFLPKTINKRGNEGENKRGKME
jgi:hypothetical protein